MNNILQSSQPAPHVEEPVITCQQDPNEEMCFHSNNFPLSYDSSESCIIQFPAAFIPQGGLVMSTVNFETEYGFDVLRINGVGYSGHKYLGPGNHWFAADDNVDIRWESDWGRTVMQGWRICFAPGSAPSGPDAIVQSDCQQDGNCFTSRNFPSNYDADEHCNIQGRAGLRMVTDSFNTRVFQSWTLWQDTLTVNGERFYGVDGPGVVDFSSNFEIGWGSFPFVTDNMQQGWRVCFAPIPGSSLVQSSCRQEAGNCVTSRNFPSNYDNNENCSITVPAGLRMVTYYFHTQLNVDYFEVSGNTSLVGHPYRFSGGFGPNVVDFGSNSEITWKTDSNGTRKGWKVCFSKGWPER